MSKRVSVELYKNVRGVYVCEVEINGESWEFEATDPLLAPQELLRLCIAHLQGKGAL